jgi:hypothetical protein
MTQPVCPVMSSSKHRRTHSEEAASAKVKDSEDFLVSKDFTTNSDRDSKVVAPVHLEIFLKSLRSFSEVNKEAEGRKEAKLR